MLKSGSETEIIRASKTDWDATLLLQLKNGIKTVSLIILSA